MKSLSTFAAVFLTAVCAVSLAAQGANAQTKKKAGTAPPAHERDCSGGPMWASIGHPGLGEMINSGRGWDGVPQRKFWLGFIPGFGWPGYLQVVSAIDAANCRTNDWPND